MNDFNLLVIPAITGIVEAIKQAGMPSRFAPVLALVLGIGSIFVIKDGNLLIGIVYGLSAMGLYAGPKAVVNP